MESPSLATEASASAMQSKTVFPGDRLFPISERLRAGIGTYELFGHIYASLFGVVHMLPATEVSTLASFTYMFTSFEFLSCETLSSHYAQ